MAQPIQTHINAYYADLVTAKQEAAAANQRVVELEEAIKARGGELPDEQPAEPTAAPTQPEDVASSDDTSASEQKSFNNPSKKESK